MAASLAQFIGCKCQHTLNSTVINVQALINDIKKGMTYKSDSGTSSLDVENEDTGQDTDVNISDPEQDEIAKRENIRG